MKSAEDWLAFAEREERMAIDWTPRARTERQTKIIRAIQRDALEAILSQAFYKSQPGGSVSFGELDDAIGALIPAEPGAAPEGKL